MTQSLGKYDNEVLKRLEKFKNAREWSDFIEPLNSLCSVFAKYKAGYVPFLPQLIKRLNQLLNPVLPGGIHRKTIECYSAMFKCMTAENLVKDFDVITIGLFDFSMNCRIGVADEYISLLESLIKQLGNKAEGFAKHVIVGFLPFLESESSDFYSKAYKNVMEFMEMVSEEAFYNALWKNFIEYPDLRIAILVFLNKQKMILIPDYRLVTNAFCIGLESDSQYIVRSILEISNRDFPHNLECSETEDAKIDIKEGEVLNKGEEQIRKTVENRSKEENDLENKNKEEMDNFIKDPSDKEKMIKSINELAVSKENGLMTEMTSISISESAVSQIEAAPRRIIKDTMLQRAVSQKEKDECNSKLIKSVLKIFLKKEIGIQKKAYRWLNVNETVVERDIDYIERGLREYLNGDSEELSGFFRIVNSLADREYLVVFLMERLILDAIEVMMTLDEQKDRESLHVIKKHARMFLKYSLDEFYRVAYVKLNEQLEAKAEEESSEEKEEAKGVMEISSISDEELLVKEKKKNRKGVEQLIKMIEYAMETLEAIDGNVTTIHIPLLSHLVVRNKKKMKREEYKDFVEKCIYKSEGVAEKMTREITPALINTFYQKENPREILEINLIGALAKELGRQEIYRESRRDAIEWGETSLVVQEGVLVWAETKKARPMARTQGKYFNFDPRDIETLQRYMEKYGHKDFPEEFLRELGAYLAFNYKYIHLINMLDYYIDHPLIRVNLWNDFIITRNPRYLMHFKDEFLTPFLEQILPTVALGDICVFLRESLRQDKYHEVLFRTVSLAPRNSEELVDLLLNIWDVKPLLQYMFERYFEEREDIREYDATRVLLVIVEDLISNGDFMRLLRENAAVEVRRFGAIGAREVLEKMLLGILERNIEELERKEEKGNKRSAIFKYRDMNWVSDSIKGNNEYIYSRNLKKETKSENEESNDIMHKESTTTINTITSDLINNQTGSIPMLKLDDLNVIDYDSNIIGDFPLNNQKEIVGHVVRILYSLQKKGITVVDTPLIKRVVYLCKQDFRVLKHCLPLLTDVLFIYSNFMHFYKPVLSLISKMKLSEAFFAYILHPNTPCTIDVLLEAWQYVDGSSAMTNEIYTKALALLCDSYTRASAIYRNTGEMYRRIEDSLLELPSPDFEFKRYLSLEDTCLSSDHSFPPLILVQCGDLDPETRLANILFSANPILFASALPDSSKALCLIGSLPFRVELCRRLLRTLKNPALNLRLLSYAFDFLPFEIRTEVIRAEGDALRNLLAHADHNPDLFLFLIRLFKNQPPTDLSKYVFLSMLHSIETLVRSSTVLDHEVRILTKLVRMHFNDIAILSALRSCCFALLTSKSYKAQGIEIIARYLRRNSNCRIFIDAFVAHFHKNFFSFAVSAKIRILASIAHSPAFDPFLIINTLTANMESSFFMSSQSEELLKLSNLRKMSALILSQPKNRFSSMSDSLVSLVNRLITLGPEIKAETLRFCSVLILKIDNHYLQTLFPILIGDFVGTFSSSDLRVVSEMIRFIDISIWLSSQVFNFKILMLEKHSFYKQIAAYVSVESDIKIDLVLDRPRLPNLLTIAFDRIVSWGQLSYYLKHASEYYNYIEKNMTERDYEAVEENLICAFEEIQ